MDSHGVIPRKEREDTDASLLAERTKTDAELADREKTVEEDEDHVVEIARERAQETLGAARDLADVEMAAAGATRTFKKEVAVDRAAADDVVAKERAGADERLRIERQEHHRALSAVLLLEREATDDGLFVERARADEVVATRDDFLGIVSHDLRNILGSIAMSAALLARRGTTEDEGAAMKGHAERIQRGAARMNRLVGDLLDVVSLEAGKLRVTPVPHDAVAIAKEAFEAFQPAFSHKGIALTTDIPASSMIVTLDHDRVLQVLGNLLSNALKFTDRGGRVSLALEAANSAAHFSVTDSGVGIPAGEQEKIFERFGQVGRDRRGHGLGLYIAKCIVEAHDGRIWVASPDAGGTALHFTLPAALA
jgi:signal transduction histidine kinase